MSTIYKKTSTETYSHLIDNISRTFAKLLHPKGQDYSDQSDDVV